MKNFKYLFIFGAVLVLWGWNSSLLNRISQRERAINQKQKEVTALAKAYDNKVVEYDSAVDLEAIRNELTKKGFKPAKEIIWVDFNRQ